MEIQNLTLEQLREIALLFGMNTSRRLPIEIGTKIFVRTITAHYTGRVTAVSEEELELDEAAWIASDGRFADLLKTGVFDEVEPFPDGVKVTLNRSTFLDHVKWPHELPREQI